MTVKRFPHQLDLVCGRRCIESDLPRPFRVKDDREVKVVTSPESELKSRESYLSVFRLPSRMRYGVTSEFSRMVKL